MISPMAFEHSAIGIRQSAFSAADVFAVGSEAAVAQQLLAVAEFCGWQEDGSGGRFQLWTLKKPIGGGLEVNSTFTRETILKQLRGGCYGAVKVPAGKSEDFQAVESPGHG